MLYHFENRFKSSPKAIFLFSILLAVSACGCASSTIYVDTDEVPGLGVEVQFPEGKVVPIKVGRIISGNIIELTNKEQVSYIGVYIPQLYNIPKEAKALNEKLLKENDIRLEFDKKKRDSKGRLLAYVYTIDGNICAGIGVINFYCYPPYI